MITVSGTGNLGRDVDVRNVNGTAVANFTVGCKSGFGDNATTVWIDCALWGKQAESKLIDYLKKGQKVSVTGEGGVRQYESNGKAGFSVTCRVSQIALCGDASGAQQQQQQAPQQQQQPAQPQQQYQQQQPAQQQQGGAQYTSGNAAAFDNTPANGMPPF